MEVAFEDLRCSISRFLDLHSFLEIECGFFTMAGLTVSVAT